MIFGGEVRREQAQPGQVHLSEAHCVDDRGNLLRCACHQDAVVGGTLRTSAPQGRRRTSKRMTVRGRACARRSRRGAAGGLPPFGTSPRRALESRHDVQDRASGDASPALRTRPRAGVRPVPRVMAKKCQRESRFIGQMTDASVGARFREPRACPGTSWTGCGRDGRRTLHFRPAPRAPAWRRSSLTIFPPFITKGTDSRTRTSVSGSPRTAIRSA